MIVFFVKITNLSTLVGTHTITCTATGGNGKSGSYNKSILIKSSYIASSDLMSTVPDSQKLSGGGGIYYIGSNPSNYVKFNNELWRIIGVFSGKMKIMSTISYGTNVVWGAKDVYSWNNSTLKNELNSTYWNTIDEIYKQMVDKNHRYTYAIYDSALLNSLPENNRKYMYSISNYYSTSNVGLPSSHDLGYSSSASSSYCETDSSDNIAKYCTNSSNSWMNNGTCYWLIDGARYNSDTYKAVLYHNSGYAFGVYADLSNRNVEFETYPVLFLLSDVKIVKGEGTASNPYELDI